MDINTIVSSQQGSGLMAELLTLGVPIGLSIAANKLDFSMIKENDKNQEGGFLEESLIKEIGLSVVPFGLISTLEYFDKDNTENNKKETKEENKENNK